MIMKYSEALKLRQESLSLIGTKDEKGLIIGDLLILPANSSERNRCLRQYVYTNRQANWAFNENQEVVLWAIDTYHLNQSNILFYKDLTSNK